MPRRCNFDAVSFHPYRSVEEFALCHNESKKVTKSGELENSWEDMVNDGSKKEKSAPKVPGKHGRGTNDRQRQWPSPSPSPSPNR